MANSYNTNPIVIDTDVANFRTAATTANSQAFNSSNGPTVSKIILAVAPGGASTGGSVSITRPADSAILYPPIVVTAAIVANTFVLNDNTTRNILNWNNFAVTGVTATGTRLFLYHE